MKTLKYTLLATLVGGSVLMTGCRDDWAEMNQDPSNVTTADPTFLLSQAVNEFEPSDYTYWFYNANDFFRITQMGVPTSGADSKYNELTGSQGLKSITVRKYYNEVKYLRDQMDEESSARYEAVSAALDVLSIYLGIFDSDFVGDIPYTEAANAAHGGTLTPKFDRISELYDLWLNSLENDAIVFTTAQDQTFTAKQDVIFNGDLNKWAKLANSLRLKIAARLISQDLNKAKQIASTVASASYGIMDGAADDMIFNKGENNTSNSDYVYHWNNGVLQSIGGSQTMINFLVDNLDPRVRFIFQKNSWNSKVVQAFFDAGKVSNVPSYIMQNIDYTVASDGKYTFNAWKGVGEPWVRYYGLPGAFNAAQDDVNYGEWFNYNISDRCQYDNSHTFRPYSLFQQEMIYGRIDFTLPVAPGDPVITDTQDSPWWGMYLTTAEVNLYLAEFKLLGANLPQTAEYYFNKATQASVEEYDYVAAQNAIPYYGTNYGYDPNEKAIDLQDGEIATMQSHAAYQLTGDVASDLEKVYIQQLIHFYLNPMDHFVTARRSGCPKFNSAILPRIDYASGNIPVTMIGRRTPIADLSPTDLMYNVYQEAYAAQGFTLGTTDMSKLNSERVWQDQGAPQWGAGPNAN